MNNYLYQTLTTYGTVFDLKCQLDCPENFIDWTEKNFKYVKYNPRKNIERYGLSITSLDGGVSGIPDLDSLYEYNNENNTKYTEEDFKVFTKVYDYEPLQTFLNPLKDHIFRSHIIKLGCGGFFPPHRDYNGINFTSFRLLVPLKNNNVPDFNFIIEDKIYHWKPGVMYFIDTAKMHYLFNAGFDPSYFLVLNVKLNDNVVNYIIKNLKNG